MENTSTIVHTETMDGYMKEMIDEMVNTCPFKNISPLLDNARTLYGQDNPQWIEFLAEYYARWACRLREMRTPDTEISTRARKTYEWICEESRYLEKTYPNQTLEKRILFEEKLEHIYIQDEAYGLLLTQEAHDFLLRMEKCLTSSGYITATKRKSRLLAYLLRFDNTLCIQQAETILSIFKAIQENKLGELMDMELLKESFVHQIQWYDEEITALWFGEDTTLLQEKIAYSVRFISLYLMMGFSGEQTDTLTHKLLAARIYRYLSKLDTPYATSLKNKAYTLLSNESTIDNRLNWDLLTNFTIDRFITQLTNIRIEELDTPVDEQDNKWEQVSNGTNAITLDKDGFTLSTISPHSQSSWKGRKEKVELLDKRFFLATFAKPTYLFKNCKSIKDYQLYWKQLYEDFPVYIPQEATGNIHRTDVESQTGQPENTDNANLPEVGEEVTIAITNTEHIEQYIEAVIIDKAYRGKKAILPSTLVNACYSSIPNFSTLIKKDQTFKARVVENNQEGTRVSLAQSYNEFVYSDNVQDEAIPAIITHCEDNKIKWLLITGTTCVTPYNRWIKPLKGSIYMVNFIGMDYQLMNARVNICKNKASISADEFYAKVNHYLQEFVNFQQLSGTTEERTLKEQELKERNNPFAQALQNLCLSYDQEEEATDMSQQETDTDDKERETHTLQPGLNITIAEELIYCIGQLAEEKDNMCELFNIYNYLQLLSRFVGNKQLEEYYSICSDYIYNINFLMEIPEKERFSASDIYKLDILSARMEMLGTKRYAKIFRFFQDVITILNGKNDTLLLGTFLQDKNPTIRSLAKYFNVLFLLSEEDDNLRHIIFHNINELLGYQEKIQKAPSVPIYFGHEGVCCEFKSSAFMHANKESDEDQSIVLARVVASFMNTDGGTLYIGVNDNGYLVGIQEDLNFVHNDRDNYLRTVNSQIIRLLGENKEAHNRYQEYLRCDLHEYDNLRMVLAFRVSPINEVVTVNGKVYTRSGSSCILKPEKNVKDFIAQRRIAALNSVPRQPIFPTQYSEERQEYAFTTLEEKEIQYTRRNADVSLLPAEADTKTATQPIEKVKTSAPVKKVKSNIKIQTSVLRVNPLQKKPEMGYTNNHLFVSLFNNGKIACSPSPKIGVWGENLGGKVICSYDKEGDEDILVCVTRSGEVGIANLKKGFSATNSLLAFVDDINDLFFISPASSNNHLLLIAEKDGTKHYRIIRLSDFDKPLDIQPKFISLLKPKKGHTSFPTFWTKASWKR